MSLKYIQQNTIANKGLKYPSKTYPYIYGKQGCIYTSGCGVCTSLMVLQNGTTNSIKLKDWTSKLLSIGARVEGGTDMAQVAKYMISSFGFKCTTTDDKNKLKEHLKKGYHAIAHVGGNGLFSTGGHYVFVGGLKGDTDDIIILDPYYYSNKFNSTEKRRQALKYNSKTNEVYVSLNNLHSDTKGSRYYLFTPTKNVDLKYSKVSTIAKEIEAKKKADEAKKKAEATAKKKAKKNKEVLLDYTVRHDVTLCFTKPNSAVRFLHKRFKKGDKFKVVKGGRVTTVNGIFFKIKIKKEYFFVPKSQVKRVK